VFLAEPTHFLQEGGGDLAALDVDLVVAHGEQEAVTQARGSAEHDREHKGPCPEDEQASLEGGHVEISRRYE